MGIFVLPNNWIYEYSSWVIPCSFNKKRVSAPPLPKWRCRIWRVAQNPEFRASTKLRCLNFASLVPPYCHSLGHFPGAGNGHFHHAVWYCMWRAGDSWGPWILLYLRRHHQVRGLHHHTLSNILYLTSGEKNLLGLFAIASYAPRIWEGGWNLHQPCLLPKILME